MSSSVLSNQANNNNNEPQTHKESAVMMLRRHSLTNGTTISQNSNDENNLNGNNCSNLNMNDYSPVNTFVPSMGQQTFGSISSNYGNSITNGSQHHTTPATKSFECSKNLTSLMKSTCPDFFQIPRSTRKRILRFLCDNGWMDI